MAVESGTQVHVPKRYLSVRINKSAKLSVKTRESICGTRGRWSL